MVSKAAENGTYPVQDVETIEGGSAESEEFDMEDIDVGDTDAEGFGARFLKDKRRASTIRRCHERSHNIPC